MKRVLTRVLPLVVVAAVAGALLLVAAMWAGLRMPFGTSTTDRSQPVLLESIEKLSEYHAAVGNFQVIVDIEKDVDWVPDFLAGERSLMVAGGTVDAYVDLGTLTDADVQLSEDEKTATVRLPEPQLGAPHLDLDPARTYLFAQDRGVVDRIKDALSPQDQQSMYRLAEQKIAAAAAQADLKRQAGENTKAMLTQLLGRTGVKVVFAGADEG